MNEQEKEQILQKSKKFFKEKIAPSHIKNTKKLVNLKEFNVNPFLISYLSNYLSGNSNPKNIAKALIYPRVLGTSINTTLGTRLQSFCSEVLEGFGSVTSGIDIEFIDAIDNRKKYCQIKAGPNTINKDDVTTIKNHFKSIKNLSRTNNLHISDTDLIIGVLYGEKGDISHNYKNIDKDYPVIVGQDFWHHLTGDKEFYFDLINAFGEVAIEIDSKDLLEETIDELSKKLEKDPFFKNI